MSRAPSLVVTAALFAASSTLSAQVHGPTVVAARAAFSTAPATADAAVVLGPPASCGSIVTNAALLGFGLSLATGVLELTYTIVREPFVVNGVDLPAADPRLIAGAAGAGFVIGLIGTERCRRRRR